MPRPIKDRDTLLRYAEFHNPKSRILLEAITVTSEDIKDTYNEWYAADSITGWSILVEGGARPLGSQATKVTTTVNNGDTITSFPGLSGSPVGVALVEWDTSVDDMLQGIGSLTAKLDPDADGSGAVVTNWGCQLFRVASADVTEFDQQEQWQLEAISRNTVVEAAAIVADVEFAFPEVDTTIGTPPDILDLELVTQVTGARPATVVVITALKADGAIADNCAWLGDTGNSTAINAGHIVTRYNLTEIDDQQAEQTLTTKNVSAPVNGLPFFSIQAAGYTTQTIKFTGANAPTLASTPTKTVEFMLEDEEPSSADGQGFVRNNGSTTWVAFTDGQTTDDLAGVSTTGPVYEMRYVATPSTSGLVAPTIRRMGVRELSRELVSGVARVGNPTYSLDPFTMKSSIPTLQLELTRDGQPDYRDYATELFSDNHAGQLEFRVHYGSTELDREQWINIDNFRLQNYESAGDVIAVDAIHPLALVKKDIPAGSTSGQDAIVVNGSTDTIPSVYGELLGAAGIPDRYKGVQIAATTSTATPKVRKTLGKPRPAKDELDRLAFIYGGAIIPSGGRLKFKQIWTSTGGLAHSPIEHFDHIIPVSVSPNLDRRIVQYRVPYDFDLNLDNGRGGFSNTAFQQSTAAISKLGHAALEPSQELDEETAQWIVGSTYAEAIAARTVAAFRQGAVVLSFKSSHPKPWLELGDFVEVKTDRFVGRGVETDRALRGRLSVVGVIIQHDMEGTEFSVWVPAIEPTLPSVNVLDIDYGVPSVHVTSIHTEAIGSSTNGDQLFQQVLTLRPSKDCKRIRFRIGATGNYTVPTLTGPDTLYKVDYSWTDFSPGKEFEHVLRQKSLGYATTATAVRSFRLQQSSTGVISDVEDGDDGLVPIPGLKISLAPISTTTAGTAGVTQILPLAPLRRQLSTSQVDNGTNSYFGGSWRVGTGLSLNLSTAGNPLVRSERNVSAYTANITASTGVDVVLANASTAAITVTLPDGTAGYREITVKKTDGSTNGVSVIGHSTADTIDGSSSTTVTTQNSAITVINNTSSSPMNWSIVASL